MSILRQFIHEYNELYYKNLSKESRGDVLQEIKQAEKAINNPKLHSTQELKQFYRGLRDQHKMPLRIMLIGSCALSQIAFINILFKNALIPLHNGLAQKKFIVYPSPYCFTKIHYKNGEKYADLYSLDCGSSSLEEIEYFEIFAPLDISNEIEIVKDCDRVNKKTLNTLRDADLIIWVIDKASKITNQDLSKIIKKKPTIAILIHDDKVSKEQALSQITSQKRHLDENFSLQAIYDVNLQELNEEYRLDEKFAICKILGTLQSQTLLSKTKSLENIVTSLAHTKNLVESFYAQKVNTKITQPQSDIMKSVAETIGSLAKDARAKRGYLLLRDALDKNKVIDQHYKILFRHYKLLDYTYHTAHKALIGKITRLIAEYNHEIFGTVSKGLKKYFESIVDSVFENIDFIQIKTRPSQPSILDIITSRRIVYESFQFNQEEFFEEIESAQGLLTRRLKSLLARLSRFDAYVTRYVQEIEQSFDEEIEEWIVQGHRLVLQKKPSYISMESYLGLEEFNLSVYQKLTKKHTMIIRELKENIHSNINALSAWVQATKTMILECIIGRLEQKFYTDKMHAKNSDFAKLQPVNRNFLVDAILEILPADIQLVFCRLPYFDSEFSHIPELLENAMRGNERKIRDKVREMIELRQILKISTKILEESIVSHQNR